MRDVYIQTNSSSAYNNVTFRQFEYLCFLATG